MLITSLNASKLKFEEEIDNMIKEKIRERQKNDYNFRLYGFLNGLGLSIEIFSKAEIDNITEMGFKYETWEKIKKEKYEEHKRNCKNICL